MDEIEQKVVADTENEAEGAEVEAEEAEAEADSEESPENKRLTPEQEKAIKQRTFKKLAKELGVELEKPSKSKKSDEFDEAQLAFLAVKGVEDEDVEFAQELQKKTGLSLRELVKDDYFQTKLKARKDARVISDATPRISKRGSSRATDSVEVAYAEYQKTGKLPADRTMAEKLIEKRRGQETGSNNNFTSNPVVGNY